MIPTHLINYSIVVEEIDGQVVKTRLPTEEAQRLFRKIRAKGGVANVYKEKKASDNKREKMFKTVNNGKLPTKGSKYSACVDLYANETVTINAGETKIIGLGVAIDLNDTWKYKNGMVDSDSLNLSDKLSEHYSFRYFKRTHYLQLNPRSSLRAKGLLSHTGIIDLDYLDEIKIIIHNPIGLVVYDSLENVFYQYGVEQKEHKHEQFLEIKKGDKIAQITLMEHKGYLLGIESKSERTGGFGSTDKIV